MQERDVNAPEDVPKPQLGQMKGYFYFSADENYYMDNIWERVFLATKSGQLGFYSAYYNRGSIEIHHVNPDLNSNEAEAIEKKLKELRIQAIKHGEKKHEKPESELWKNCETATEVTKEFWSRQAHGSGNVPKPQIGELKGYFIIFSRDLQVSSLSPNLDDIWQKIRWATESGYLGYYSGYDNDGQSIGVHHANPDRNSEEVRVIIGNLEYFGIIANYHKTKIFKESLWDFHLAALPSINFGYWGYLGPAPIVLPRPKLVDENGYLYYNGEEKDFILDKITEAIKFGNIAIYSGNADGHELVAIHHENAASILHQVQVISAKPRDSTQLIPIRLNTYCRFITWEL